jgi:ATP adenylyltransferase
MDKMWSPWRSKYIDSFKNKKESEDCIFCAAPVSDIHSDESLIVHSGEFSFIVLNLYPYNNGHLMVVPKRHLNDLRELKVEEINEINIFINSSISALENCIKPQGYNVGVNMGKAAGAGIDTHLHYHIVPRWNGDTNFMPVLGEVKVISQDLLDIKKKLSAELLKILNKK